MLKSTNQKFKYATFNITLKKKKNHNKKYNTVTVRVGLKKKGVITYK